MSTEVRRSRWSRPLVGVASVAVVGAGLGAFFGIRAVQGAGSASASGQPPARTGAAMAYDPANGSVVLFGGQSRLDTLHDTWIWNGSAWAQAEPATSPPPLDNPQMTYDPVTHDVLLVGSQRVAGNNHGAIECSNGSGTSSSGSASAATGSTTVIPPDPPVPTTALVPVATPAPSPPAKVRQPTPVSPGCATILSPAAATWLWNGSDWSKASGSTPYSVLGSAALATDPVAGRVVLLARGPFAVPALGVAEPAIACPVQSGATPDVQPKCPWPFTVVPAWTWNGHQWKEMASSPATSSFGSFNSSIVADAVSGKLVSFGGNVALPGPAPSPCSRCLGSGGAVQPSAATGTESVWNGTTWRHVTTYTSGPSIPGVALVGDPTTHSDVALTEDGQTWLWTGVWTRVHPGTTPPLLSGVSSAYDAATGQVVLFGGAGTTSRKAGLYDQTWTWNGSDWSRRGGTSGPSVIIPVPSPVSVPPGLPCEPVVEPAQAAGTPAPPAKGVCGVTTVPPLRGGSSGSSGSSAGIATNGGVAAS